MQQRYRINGLTSKVALCFATACCVSFARLIRQDARIACVCCSGVWPNRRLNIIKQTHNCMKSNKCRTETCNLPCFRRLSTLKFSFCQIGQFRIELVFFPYFINCTIPFCRQSTYKFCFYLLFIFLEDCRFL